MDAVVSKQCMWPPIHMRNMYSHTGKIYSVKNAQFIDFSGNVLNNNIVCKKFNALWKSVNVMCMYENATRNILVANSCIFVSFSSSEFYQRTVAGIANTNAMNEPQRTGKKKTNEERNRNNNSYYCHWNCAGNQSAATHSNNVKKQKIWIAKNQRREHKKWSRTKRKKKNNKIENHRTKCKRSKGQKRNMSKYWWKYVNCNLYYLKREEKPVHGGMPTRHTIFTGFVPVKVAHKSDSMCISEVGMYMPTVPTHRARSVCSGGGGDCLWRKCILSHRIISTAFIRGIHCWHFCCCCDCCHSAVVMVFVCVCVCRTAERKEFERILCEQKIFILKIYFRTDRRTSRNHWPGNAVSRYARLSSYFDAQYI